MAGGIFLAGCTQRSAEPDDMVAMRLQVQSLLTQARAEQAQFSVMTDSQRVQANQKEGLGLSLSVPKTSFRLWEPIPLHVAIEDLEARVAISAGLCHGFGVAYQNTESLVAGYADIGPAECVDDPFYRSAIAMPKGKLVAIDLMITSAKLDLPPGLYVINLSWQSYEVGKEGFWVGPLYKELRSNYAVVTILP